MKKLFFLFLLFLFSCATNPAMMTRDQYVGVSIGMNVSEVQQSFGKPYQIISRGHGEEIYQYIEKITMGTEVIEQRSYYIVIQDGKVVGKYMKLSNPPPFEAIYSEDPYRNY